VSECLPLNLASQQYQMEGKFDYKENEPGRNGLARFCGLPLRLWAILGWPPNSSIFSHNCYLRTRGKLGY
jgi:hypothetical protein